MNDSPILSFQTQHSFTVILNAAQRSEESKIIANTPFTDLRFPAALGMTGDKWEMSTQPILSFRMQPSLFCHSEQSACFFLSF